MRTTIEIPDHLRAALLSVAARKGYRGYSKVIVGALEYYLSEKEAKKSGLDRVLALKGSWSSSEAAKVRKRIDEARTNWQRKSQ